jgi:hypothetical protein
MFSAAFVPPQIDLVNLVNATPIARSRSKIENEGDDEDDQGGSPRVTLAL